MQMWFELAGWLACAVYSTIPAFWFMIHPFAERWRARHVSGRSPYVVLIPVWVAMWAIMALATRSWRHVALYSGAWTWVPAVLLFAIGITLYAKSGKGFSAKQLGGMPELHGADPDQRLATDGIRAHVRHPVYLAHLCEMLAWSVGTGLAVCWTLTAFAIATGAVMIHMEDAELEKRFGDAYRRYRDKVPAIFPRASSTQMERARLGCDGIQIHYESQGRQIWQIAIADLVCIGEYTNEAGPWLDDYFLVFAMKNGVWYEASFYSDACDETLAAVGKALGCELTLGLFGSTTYASRIVWPTDMKGRPLIMAKGVNPEVRQPTKT